MNENIIIAVRQIDRKEVDNFIKAQKQVWYILGFYNQCEYLLIKVDEGIFEALKDIFEYDDANKGWFVDLKEFKSGENQTFIPGNWRFFQKCWFDNDIIIETENDLYKIFKSKIREKKKTMK